MSRLARFTLAAVLVAVSTITTLAPIEGGCWIYYALYPSKARGF